MSKKRNISQQIEAVEEEIRQREARLKQLKQEEKEQAKKEKTRRLCQRGDVVEKLLPDLARLSDDQFNIFVNKCLLTTYCTRILTELLESKDNDEASTARQLS